MNGILKTALALYFALSLTTGLAQPRLWIETTDGEEGMPLRVTVKTAGLTDMAYFQFSLKWDTAVLQYSGLHSLNSTLGLTEPFNFGTDSTGNGKLMALWFSSTGAGQSLPDSSVLFGVEFTVIGQGGDVSVVCFSDEPIPIAFGDTSGPVTPDLTNGTLEVFDIMAVAADIRHNGCFGEASGEIHLSVSGGSGQFAFNWEDGSAATSVQDLAAGTYAATITDLQTSNSIDTAFAIAEPPELMVIESQVVPDTNGLGTGWASVAPGGGTPPYSYAWDTSPAQADSVATGLHAGNYTVTITDGNGCQLIETIGVATSIQEAPRPAELKVFPNPATDRLAIETALPVSGQWQLSIINEWGLKVFHAGLNGTVESRFEYDVSHLPPGLYFVRIASGTFVSKAQKFIRQDF
ncbi:MAG: T9SS type A sorting domain-containing protein [Phaeodactylibacter sp.]|nr:T9SS type A sorting domain-containing protein [Phaeodactylibacter sp.]